MSRLYAAFFIVLSLICPVFAADMALNPADLGVKDVPANVNQIPVPGANDLKQPAAAAGQDAGEKAKALINKLGSTSPITDQTFAKNQLIKMDKQAVPFLNDAVQNDKRTYTRIQVANILGKMKNESSVPALAGAAKSQYPQLNMAAVKSLGEIGGPKAQAALEQLQGATKDKDVAKEIQNALAKIKGK